MTDSSNTTITHFAIIQRAKQDSLEYMPAMPTRDSAMDWESYIQRLEDLDAFGIAHESAEWDWVIYYYRAMQVCQAVPSAVLHEAESEVYDNGGIDHLQGYGCNRSSDNFGLYEMAALIASQIVVIAILEAVEECRDELLELANDKLDQMENL